MFEKALWLITGIVVGAVGSVFFHAPPENTDLREEVLAESALPNRDAGAELSHAPEQVNGAFVGANKHEETDGDLEVPETATTSSIPVVYEEVIGQPRPRVLRVADRHAIFLTEPRDEVWASTMESGIKNYLADNAANTSMVVEFIECRSEHCEVAGYVSKDSIDDIQALKNGLKSSAWWQGGVSSATRNREIDGVTYFVTIFNRNVDWTVQ